MAFEQIRGVVRRPDGTLDKGGGRAVTEGAKRRCRPPAKG